MIQSIGLFWRRDNVFWGRGNQAGMLLGVPAGNVTAEAADFREQVGIYALYAEYEIVYVGQTGNGNQKLLHRLKQHRSDDLAERWDRFSWFGLRRVLNSGRLSNVNQATHPSLRITLDHMEAILIHAAEPRMNRQGGRFGEAVTRYLQVRDERLGPTEEEMIREIWNETGGM